VSSRRRDAVADRLRRPRACSNTGCTKQLSHWNTRTINMREREYSVYILTNKRNTVLYTGVTGNLEQRIGQHKEGLTQGFSSRYKANKLVYIERFDYVHDAIAREKQIKAGSRKRKVELIKSINPTWSDLSYTLR